MPNFSLKSMKELATCEQDLQGLFDSVVEKYDCTILQGHRSIKEQQELFKKGATKVKYSEHNCEPSNAVDVSPYPIPENWGKVSWGLIENKEHREEIKKQVKELHKFYHFAGYVKGMADACGTDIRWGGDWDGDKDFNDQIFDDLVHFEKK